MGRYDGKNAVVTGGGSGIGLGMAELLVDGGARVVITGRSQDTLDAAREKLGENAVAVRGDVSSTADLDELADRVKNDLGTLDALFVNAGVTYTTPFGATSEEAFDEMLAVNVRGAFFTVQKLVPLMGAGSGVVLTTSAANVLGIEASSGYAAGKAAVRAMARNFARDLLPRGIRVNAVSPGPIDTGILESMMSKEEAEAFKARMVADTPMGRFGGVEEIAGAAAFLAFDATFTTGAELAVDGGRTQL